MLYYFIILLSTSILFTQRIVIEASKKYNFLLKEENILDRSDPTRIDPTEKASLSLANFFGDDLGGEYGFKFFWNLSDEEMRREIIIGISTNSAKYDFLNVNNSNFYGKTIEVDGIYQFLGYGQEYRSSYFYALIGLNKLKISSVNINDEFYPEDKYQFTSDIIYYYDDAEAYKVVLGADYKSDDYTLVFGYGFEYEFGETQFKGSKI